MSDAACLDSPQLQHRPTVARVGHIWNLMSLQSICIEGMRQVAELHVSPFEQSLDQ